MLSWISSCPKVSEKHQAFRDTVREPFLTHPVTAHQRKNPLAPLVDKIDNTVAVSLPRKLASTTLRDVHRCPSEASAAFLSNVHYYRGTRNPSKLVCSARDTRECFYRPRLVLYAQLVGCSLWTTAVIRSLLVFLASSISNGRDRLSSSHFRTDPATTLDP